VIPHTKSLHFKFPLRSLLSFFLLCLTPANCVSSPDISADAVLRDHLWHDLTKKPEGKRPAIGLVLSAGGTRATAHIGVLSALQEAGFPIDIVAGTSMGALIGSFYVSGKSLELLRKLSLTMTVKTGSNFSPVSLIKYILYQKFFSSKKLEEFVQKELGNRRFEDLPKPFACVAMDINSGEAIIFREGRIAPAVRASANLPAVFEPVKYRHRYLVDGAIVDYVPVDAARLLGAKWVLASVTQDDYTRTRPNNVISSLQQINDIRGAIILNAQKKLANFVIEPSVGEVPSAGGLTLYVTPTPWIIDRGVLAATKALKKAKESYILFSMYSLAEGYLSKKGISQ
jgi:NTE family protein